MEIDDGVSVMRIPKADTASPKSQVAKASEASGGRKTPQLRPIPQERLTASFADIPKVALDEIPDAALAEAPDVALAEAPDAALGETPEVALDEMPEAALDKIPEAAQDTEPPTPMEISADTSAEQPMKLEMFGTEEEYLEDSNSPAEVRGDGSTAGEKSPSPMSDEEEETSGGATKRKRYEVRRSGSEECLLGFNEQSGEAELVPDKDEILLAIPSTSAKCRAELAAQGSTGSDDSPLPPAAKKLKQSTSTATASPKPQPLPAKLSPKSPAVKAVECAEDHAYSSAPPTPTLSPPPSLPPTLVVTPGATPVATKQSRNIVLSGTPVPGKKVLTAHSDFYKKPFEYGWRRELVWRANMETSKDKADVYFISPTGKKLRTRNDIMPLLGTELTIEHFCFLREPLGAAPEFETVRNAKSSSRIAIPMAAPTPPATTMGKRVSKPKGPKGASPPPQGWTPTKALKVNNAALLSSTNRSASTGTNHGTPTSAARSSRSISGRSGSGSGHAANNKHSKSKKMRTSANTSNATAPATDQPHQTAAAAGGRTTAAAHEPCSITCARAKGAVPQLQCVKCLCLYHHECVGLSRDNSEYRTVGGHSDLRDYICEACQPPPPPPPPLSANKADRAQPPPAGALTEAPPKAARSTPKLVASKPIVRADKKLPQTIAVVKGKKYVMIANTNVNSKRNSQLTNDIDNDVRTINESLRRTRNRSTLSMDANAANSGMGQQGAHGATGQQVNKQFGTNFFANVSYGYDALLCIFKYLKIHERPRAASVSKVWHAAAKDTSLWHTVRMKNSKVYNWAGFTAALRRGETKRLDLRKMLVASNTRGEEMWQDFSVHIGSVSTMNQIDLCRCSARVVESLFESNRELRVLNAIAINDDSINLENVTHLQKLEELRLRTCEPGALAGELQPLAALSGLVHLSLTAMRGMGVKGVTALGELKQLRWLELGECGDFDTTFADTALPQLQKLHRLRLENGTETGCCTLAILEAVAQLPLLLQLELVNFDIKPGFDVRMRQCTQLRKLLIIPTYISQSATTNHTVLSAVQQVADTLTVFTWGVTVELLRVTALYVDQCEESTKKEKHHFDQCIPVLKPVPGAPPPDDDDELMEEQTRPAAEKQQPIGGESIDGDGADNMSVGAGGDNDEASGKQCNVPQIEILPLAKVESILRDNLPTTKYTIVKVPYHATCKQQLVE